MEPADTVFERLDITGNPSETRILLDGLGAVAAVCISAALKVLDLNRDAAEILGAHAGQSVSALPIDPEDRVVLMRRMSVMLGDPDAAPSIYRVRAADDENFLVLHMRRAELANGTPIIVAATSAVSWPSDFETTLREVFGMSSAESDVVRLIVNCRSAKEIAEIRGRSIATVRSQVKTILSKTETHGQIELVRLVLSMMDVAAVTQDNASTGPALISGGTGKLAPLPFQTVYTEDARRLDYLVIGDPEGCPVVYMPTEFQFLRWPASAEAEAKRRGLRVIVAIRCGYCMSDEPPEGAVYHEQVTRDLFAVLDEEGIKRLPVLSILDDFLMNIAMEDMRPGTISGIVATAGGLPYLSRDQVERMHRWHRFVQTAARYSPRVLPFLVKMATHLFRRSGKKSFIEMTYGGSPAHAETLRDPEVMETLLTGSEVSISDQFNAHAAFIRHTLFEQEPWLIDAVHFLSGLQDPAMPKETLEEHFEVFDWIDFRLYEDAGQLLFFQHWRDALDLIEQYLENQDRED